ncbi:hypothetical protein DsansV1_C17g0143321 [Dioscorea sansibarensis]
MTLLLRCGFRKVPRGKVTEWEEKQKLRHNEKKRRNTLHEKHIEKYKY